MARLLLAAAVAAAAAAIVAYRERGRRRAAARAARLGTVGFAGLGNMGVPIARRVLERQLALTVWNRTEARCAELCAEGALQAPTLDFLLKACNTVVLMLSDDAALKAAISKVSANTSLRTVVCLSTISPACAHEAAQDCAALGVDFVCCPVTGRPDRAQAGQLKAWISGTSPLAVDLVATELCPAFADKISVLSVSDASLASTFKLITNFIIYGSVELVAEATALALKSGLPRSSIAQFVDAMAPRTFIAGYAQRVCNEAYDAQGGAGLDVGLKDCRLIQRLAPNADVPVLQAILANLEAEEALAEAKSHGSSRAVDISSLARSVERRAGL